MIELKDVGFAYEAGRLVLEHVDLVVRPGERVVLRQPNGWGKSTIARLMCGSLAPSSGTVAVDGQTQGLERLVGYVRQDPLSQIVCASVEDEVAFGPRCLCLEPAEVRARVAEALELCGISELRGRLTSELSGGQQQLVCVAGVVAMRPRYVVFDEAGSMLDARGRARLEQVVGRLLERGVGVVEISHPAAPFGASGALEAGSGAPEAAPDMPVGSFEGGIKKPSVHNLKKHALELQNIEVMYGSICALHNFSAHFEGLTLMTGPSGAGKSTASRVLAGVLEPTAGQALLDGIPVRAGRVGLCFQRPAEQLFASTVLEDIAYGPLMAGAEPAEAESLARAAAARLGVGEELLDRSPFELSGGQARRVALAGVVASQSAAYVFDEPTVGLDAEGRATLRTLVGGLVAEGAAVALATHDPEEWDAPAVAFEPAASSGCTPRGAAAGTPRAPSAPPARRLDARIAVVGLCAATVAAFAAHSALGAALLTAGLTGALAASGTGLRDLARALKPAALLFALVLVGNALVLVGQPGLSPQGLARGVQAVLRIAAVVGFVQATARLTRADELADALCAPLARLGRADACLAVSVALRFMPLVMDEVDRIRCAQRARGARFDEGGLAARLGGWTQVLVPLLVGLYRRADELAQAMRERCYTGRQTVMTEPLGPRGWLGLLALIGWAVAVALL